MNCVRYAREQTMRICVLNGDSCVVGGGSAAHYICIYNIYSESERYNRSSF